MGSNIIVGLDIGTTKTRAVVAEANGTGAQILGVGTSPSTGIRKGMIINIDATVDSIKMAIKDGESFSGTRIKSVSVGISGRHIKGFNSSGAVGIRGREVLHDDIERAIDSAKAVYIPLDREVLHVIPTEFAVDEQEGIVDPLGMSGVRLEAKVHIITGAVSPIQNLIKCCENADLEVASIVLDSLASAHSTLTKDEKDFGVLLIDIGGGTTDIALFKDGFLRYINVLGIGGAYLTNDIAIGLRVNMQEAERLKKNAGAAVADTIDNNSEEIHITHTGGQERILPRRCLVDILQPRCEEMLEMINEEIKACFGYEMATCGVVLTGGASLLNSFDKLAGSVLGLPVRIGMPVNINSPQPIVESPIYSTGVGIVKYVSDSDSHRIFSKEIMNGILGIMKDWVKGVFR
jgi:cell division protein FtsA